MSVVHGSEGDMHEGAMREEDVRIRDMRGEACMRRHAREAVREESCVRPHACAGRGRGAHC